MSPRSFKVEERKPQGDLGLNHRWTCYQLMAQMGPVGANRFVKVEVFSHGFYGHPGTSLWIQVIEVQLMSTVQKGLMLSLISYCQRWCGMEEVKKNFVFQVESIVGNDSKLWHHTLLNFKLLHGTELALHGTEQWEATAGSEVWKDKQRQSSWFSEITQVMAMQIANRNIDQGFKVDCYAPGWNIMGKNRHTQYDGKMITKVLPTCLRFNQL